MKEQFKRLPESVVGSKIRIREYLEALSKDNKIAWTALNGGPFFDMCKSSNKDQIQRPAACEEL